MKRFLPYMRLLAPVRWAFFAAVLCGAIAGATSGALLPYVTDMIIGSLFKGEHDFSDPEIVGIVSLLPITFLIRGTGTFLNAYLVGYCGLRVVEQIRVSICEKLQELHLQFFGEQKSGDLLSRVMNDTEQVKQTVIRISNDVVVQPFTLIGAIGFLAYQSIVNSDVAYILLMMAAVPVCVLPIRYFGKRMYRRAAEMQRDMGGVVEFARESLSGMAEIQILNLQAARRERFRSIVKSYLALQLKVIKYGKILSPSIEVITGLFVGAALFYAARARVGPNEIAGILLALYMAYEPVKRLGAVHNEIRRGTASLDRLEEVLEAESAVQDAPAAAPLPEAEGGGRIRMDGVEFAYGKLPALADVNCEIQPGEVIALVGRSGAGKSTFANLIPRFFDPQKGAVYINGANIREATLASLRDHIALVPQEPALFNDSIAGNIRMGRLTATQQEVEAAAVKAHADEFIRDKAEGYETLVGEKGAQLSGGQRQRIALARAFLRDAPIVILDEATSALDSDSERKIQEALKELVSGKTVILIAHRFSTIQFADRIFVFDEGRIVAQGPHAEVHQNCSVYRRLYDQQRSGMAEASAS